MADAQILGHDGRADIRPRRTRRCLTTASAQVHYHGERAGPGTDARLDSIYLHSRRRTRPGPRLGSTYLRARRRSRPRPRLRSHLPTFTAGLALSSDLCLHLRQWRGSGADLNLRRYLPVRRRRHADSYLGSHVRWRRKYTITAEVQIHHYGGGADARLRRPRGYMIAAAVQAWIHDHGRCTGSDANIRSDAETD